MNRQNNLNDGNVSLLNIGYWNVNGISSLNCLNNSDINTLQEFDILCLCETWFLGDNLNLPASFGGIKGRPSGGIVILLKYNLFESVSILESSDCWFFLRLAGQSIYNWYHLFQTKLGPLKCNEYFSHSFV